MVAAPAMALPPAAAVYEPARWVGASAQACWRLEVTSAHKSPEGAQESHKSRLAATDLDHLDVDC